MSKSILLADDSLTIQKVIELTFSDTDYELTTVSNGVEALAAVARARPDLVMADVVMPGKNGYEVCEAIKSDPALADVPVILLSGTFEPFRPGSGRACEGQRHRDEALRFEESARRKSKRSFNRAPVLADAPSPFRRHRCRRGLRPDPGDLVRPDHPAHVPRRSLPGIRRVPAENAFEEALRAGQSAERGPLDADRARASRRADRVPARRRIAFGHAPARRALPPPRRRRRPAVRFPPRTTCSNFRPPSPSASRAKNSLAGDRWKATRRSRRRCAGPGLPQEPLDREPVFLSREPEPDSSAENSAKEAPAASSSPAPTPRPLPPPSRIRHRTAGPGASPSDLASMVSRIAGPAPFSEEDAERISRRVIEHLSDKVVRTLPGRSFPTSRRFSCGSGCGSWKPTVPANRYNPLASSTELPKTFDPSSFEQRQSRRREEAGAFRPSGRPGIRKFSVVIAPPNITGKISHRPRPREPARGRDGAWKRMRGFRPCGFLERTMRASRLSSVVERRSPGRESTAAPSAGRLRGESLGLEAGDQGLDPEPAHAAGLFAGLEPRAVHARSGLSRAVRKVFVDLHRDGLIYRGRYVVNWCPGCGTAVSDLEVNHVETPGKLYFIKYDVEGDDVGAIVATTRPETMLGDMALAIAPDDPRTQRPRGQDGHASDHRGAAFRSSWTISWIGNSVRHREDHSGARPQRLRGGGPARNRGGDGDRARTGR